MSGVEVPADVSRRVLVAEDDPAVRTTLVEILSQAGYDVVGAADGEAASKILGEQHVDVLMLDLHMPTQGGLGLLEEMDAPLPAVIIYSAFAYVTLEQVRDQVPSKVFRLVRKPVSPTALIAAVGDAIDELEAQGD